MTARLSIAEALKQTMLEEKAKYAWSGDPDLMLTAYGKSGGRVIHPLDKIAAVVSAARKSKLFEQKGYIRACDSSGRREILHPVFVLKHGIDQQVVKDDAGPNAV